MTWYLVRLQHHHITPEYGTIDDSDHYDHYIGDMHEQTNLRFVVVDEKGLDDLTDAYIPEDSFDYESINIMWEFYYDYEIERFLKCMKHIGGRDNAVF